MKFVPRDLGEAAEASNPGAPKMRREIVYLLAATAALALAAYLLVGWVVELLLPRISVENERKWFSDVTLSMRTVAPAAGRETAQLAAARAVLARLARDPRVPALDYKVVLVDERGPNAFAFPGGTIGLTRGMLEIADDEIALAFVLGHELGHFAQRDHLRGIGRTVGRALVWALIFGDTADSLSQNSGALLDLAHSRGQETGADRLGLSLVLATYGKAEGSERVFKWMALHQSSPRWLQWLQTHPAPGDRVERLQAEAKQVEK